MHLLKLSRFLSYFIILFTTSAHAGFLEMPDVKETPEFERRTLLTDMDVPGVKDRDPDPEAGPRLNVKEFRLQGVVEYPELGISREEIIKRVESIRFELMKEDKLTDTGYSDDELGEISDLLGSIEENTKGEHVGPLEVQKLVFLIRDQRRRRGVTLGMIETVADTITRYYRERGFILAKAYIPKQQVRDGVVTLTLLLGDLGSVDVVNNKRYKPKIIKRVFKDVLDKPVTNQVIEERLYLVNDMPGIAVQGFFSPGKQVGDTALSVNVVSERWYNANIRIDNHGSERTGENRLFADFTLNNPLGIGDALNLSVLKSSEADGTTYGAARYTSVLFNSRYVGSIGVSTNEFFANIGNGTTGFGGQSLVADASLSYKIKRSRTKNRSVSFTVRDIETTIDFQGENATEALNMELSYGFDRLNQVKQVLHSGSVSLVYSDLSAGESIDGRIEQGKAPFLKANYSRLSFNEIPFTDIKTRLVSNVSFQYAGSTLGSVNQFDLSGPSRARGFDVTRFFADDALNVSVDWIFKGPGDGSAKLFGQRLDRAIQPFLLFDAAYGVVNPTTPTEENKFISLANVGVGLKLNIGRGFKANFVLAHPIHEKFDEEDTDLFSGGTSNDDEDESSTNVFFDLLYSF